MCLRSADPQRGARGRASSTCFRRSGSATAGPGTPGSAAPAIRAGRPSGRRRAARSPRRPARPLAARGRSRPGGPRTHAAVLRERDQRRRASSGRRDHALSRRTASTTTSSSARRRVNPARRRHEDGVLVPHRRSTPAPRVELRLRLARADDGPRRAPISAPASSACSPIASATPTSSMPRCGRTAPATTRPR